MTETTLTPEQAQAAMDAAVAKENEVDAAYRHRREAASLIWVDSKKEADYVLDVGIVNAKAIRDVDMAVAKKETAKAGAMVRRAAQAASRAKAEARAAAEAPNIIEETSAAIAAK
jgi:hypothetical protein